MSNWFWFLGTSGSSGSAGTAIRLNSQDSTASVDDAGSPWNATRQTSISLREWDIPYEELKIADKIGSGRFSTGNFFVSFMRWKRSVNFEMSFWCHQIRQKIFCKDFCSSL